MKKANQLRKIEIVRNYTKHAAGSVLIKWGDTWVLCTASVEDKVPPFLRDTGRGWVTAEYSMLPRANRERSRRDVDKLKLSGRSAEIQRLIGRSLRAAVDCLKVGGRLVVMSYHSVEDRCVKDTAAEFEKACICPENLPVCMCGGNHQRLKKVNRKPILPSAEEIEKNSRARSAKLRVYERV